MEGWRQAVLYGSVRPPRRDRSTGGRLGSIFAFVGALAIATGVVLALYSWLFGGDGPPELKLDVPQTASAAENGVHVSIDAAAFSGTATFVRLIISPEGGDAVEVRIPEAAIEISGFSGPFVSPPLRLLPGQARVVRIEDIPSGSEPVLTVRRIELVGADGTTVQLTGAWRLVLTLPADVLGRLWVESIRPAGPIVNAGVIVSIEESKRSATETLLTMRVTSSEAVEPLGQPEIRAAGRRYVGELLSRDGDLFTYRFPPTRFGSGIEFSAGPFVRSDATGSGFVAIDLLVPATRSANLPSGANEVALDAADVVASSGGMRPTALKVFPALGDITTDNSLRELTVTLLSEFPAAGYPFVHAHLGATGAEVQAGLASKGLTSTSPSQVAITYKTIDEAHSLLYLWIDGRDDSVIYGTWELRLQP